MEVAFAQKGVTPTPSIDRVECHACHTPFDCPTSADDPWCAHCAAYRNRMGVPLSLKSACEELVYMLTPEVMLTDGVWHRLAILFPRLEAERRYEAERAGLIGLWSCDMRDVNGQLWRIAAAPCGEGCFCGSTAVPLRAVEATATEGQ